MRDGLVLDPLCALLTGKLRDFRLFSKEIAGFLPRLGSNEFDQILSLIFVTLREAGFRQMGGFKILKFVLSNQIDEGHLFNKVLFDLDRFVFRMLRICSCITGSALRNDGRSCCLQIYSSPYLQQFSLEGGALDCLLASGFQGYWMFFLWTRIVVLFLRGVVIVVFMPA